MNTPSNDDEEEIFFRAAALPPLERAAFVAIHCENTPLVRARIERLLAVHEDDAFMETPAAEALAAFPEHDASNEQPGERIGNYRLIEPLGSGGFGTVWRAEQVQPVRREVAVKIIKLGMDTREVIARFEQERQALALMDHAHVARVFDAGVTQSGRPFMVMELVRGMRITDWCDARRFPVTARLELFILVCEAVQHAHQKGLIHRDLKPSNILVAESDGQPVPKVIDFGVAKATQGRLTDATLVTPGGQMIGTPLYMSPEQAASNERDVDTRSDIYSLGVLLYELLTGQRPFESAGLVHDELRRAIRERDPRKPSSALTTLKLDRRTALAKARQCEPAKLQRTLRGDLDRIVMKALEKDREHRYQTANGLAMDVRRFLDREPIVARPPGALYRLRRLVQRNKVVFALGTAIFLAVLAGLIASLAQAKRAARALEDLRKAAPAFAAQARALATAERFDEAIERIEYAARLRPDVAEYPVAKGDLLQVQLRLREAAETYREALRIDPAHVRAKANLALSKRLLAAQGSLPQLPHAGLTELFEAMQQERRTAAELLSVARLLGEENRIPLEVWRERLAGLPVSPERPLAARLERRADGLLSLDLSGTGISNLSALEGLPLGALNLRQCGEVRDLRPLRSLPLRELSLFDTAVTDLSPLADLRKLETLTVPAGTTSVESLRGLPLTRLIMQMTRCPDLSPLAGMPLTDFDATGSSTIDFSPLAGAPLDRCAVNDTPVRELGFLRGMPVRTLMLLSCPDARDFAVLSTLPKLELLILPKTFRMLAAKDAAAIDALRGHPSLRQISDDVPPGTSLDAIPSAQSFWAGRDLEEKLFDALRAGGHSWRFRPENDRTWFLAIDSPAFADLSILRGFPISNLVIQNTAVTDLNPLADLPLKTLHLGECAGLRDFAPLALCRLLEEIRLPSQAQEIEFLRELPNLKRLSYHSQINAHVMAAGNFWKAWDGRRWFVALREAGFDFVASQFLAGTWSVTVRSSDFRDATIFGGSNVRWLDFQGTAFGDLRALADFHLERLDIRRTAVADLSPLRGSVLARGVRDLWIGTSCGADFSALADCANLQNLNLADSEFHEPEILRGMPLHHLQLSRTKVGSLEVFAGMPLEEIYLQGTPVTDLSPLLKCPTLRMIQLPREAKNVEALRELRNLTHLGYDTLEPTADFWRGFDAGHR